MTEVNIGTEKLVFGKDLVYWKNLSYHQTLEGEDWKKTGNEEEL